MDAPVTFTADLTNSTTAAAIDALLTERRHDEIERYLWSHPENMAAIDAVLLTKVLEYVTTHPEEWNQGSWVRIYAYEGCGTTACLAGTTVLLAGYDVDWKRGYEKFPDGSVSASVTTSGESIERLAQQLLGLSGQAATRLFHYYGSDVAELWHRAAELTGGRVEVPVEFAR